MDTGSVLNGVIGGVLIGVSAVVLMGMMGRILGISGIVSGLLFDREGEDRNWRLCFVLGVIGAPLALGLFAPGWGNVAGDPAAVVGTPVTGLPLMILAGLLVGIGTGIGSGCTSGHGVCGMARLSWRSIIATIVFVVFGMATVYVLRHLMGGGA